ncbi:glycoside hydrolase family 2 TIM barrel-domain containing protein [Sphingomonas sp. Root241]|uniref:glycoside hydrolase family 2 TIM barrel-domain containing protein n=1 Tax=Sphingomonas sp. Root241 TaxID=1736501 RepID=UPI0006FE5996|nr:glycoside hydrolase family 2 TIM barrel-domain containing protein [Sphingomonas sp. Root241]KRC79882.1 glycoside hydrolase [Sphingomonas sp. Root241]
MPAALVARLALVLLAAFLWGASGHAQVTGTTPIEADWRFSKGDVAGAEAAGFADAAWQRVDLPHDWAIAGPFDAHAPATGSGGFLPSGVAWYRKHFTIPTADAGKRVFVEFDGAMERSGVWINGHHVGHRPNGYASFRYELTPHLNPAGQDNVIAVRTDTSAQPASRWYAGSGIYRHVRLIMLGDVYADAWRTAVRVDRLDGETAQLSIASDVTNRGAAPVDARLEATILAPDGKTIATFAGTRAQLAVGRATPLTLAGSIAKARRWDINDPALHVALVRVRGADGTLLYEERIPFGIREAKFEAASGFWLNGRNIKLKGVAIHADGGPFGMAVPLAFYERRLKGLKALGVTAIRTAHHPFAPEFLDLCDRLGLVVMNEAFDMWTVAKNPNDYHLFFTDWSSIDARDFVRRDRNHPSVVIWSIGNEIHDTPYPLVAQSIIQRLQKVFHEEDPTRPVTMALFRPNTTKDYENGTADLLDVVGQNYRENELAKAHADKPTRKIIGTENSKNRASWLVVRDNPAYAGMFLWTGVDYLGEADRAGWPAISNPSGLVDRIDGVKPIGWERASWWSEKPVVKLARRVTPVIDTSELPTMVGVAMPQPRGPGALADWTPETLAAHDEKVEVYSNADEVELLLNGRSLARKPRNADDSAIAWTVGFVPGELRAVGYRGGKKVAEDVLRTAGAPAAIRMVAETPKVGTGFDQVAAIRIEIVDAKGVLVPGARDLLTVTVTGPAALAALDNGSITDHTAFASPQRAAAGGKAVTFVRGTGSGKVTVLATAPGLKPGRVTLQADGD